MKKIFVAVFLFLVGVLASPTASFAYDGGGTVYDCDNGGDFPMRFAGCKPGYYYEDWQSADDSLGPEDVGECLECPSGYNCAGGFAGPVLASPCSTGYYGTSAESCSACTNKPAHSTYTGAATTNSCPWQCDSGYGENNGSCVACSAGDIWVNGTCQTTQFSITTTNLSANTKFAFVMTAAGTFYVDWGDGTTETISRTNNTPAKYSHTYTTGGVKTIRFGGTATGYADPDRYEQPPAIAFATYVTIYDYDTDEDYTYYELGAEFIASVSGNMSAVFPWLSGNSATGAQPRFYSTFEGATNLSSIDGNLFANYTTGSNDMFYGTFYGCTSLESIPAGLFSSITTGANSMFSGTFQACTSLQSIPAGLFGNITTGAGGMFYQTFSSCTSLQSIPAGLFGNITTGADSMFGYTFYKCTSLQSIPAELFSGITTGAVSMFSNTFYGCTSLESIPAGLFSNITTGASNMFQLTFANCTNLSGYIPPTTFKKGMGSYSGMWHYTFTNTQLATSCPAYTTQYITGYEGSNVTTTWSGKVSCQVTTSQTCAAGEYLPAAYNECTACAVGSYCTGGTYSFNASAAQGLTSACPTGYTSNAGASAENQCYITVSGGHYIGTAGQNSTNWDTCAAGYAKAEHTVNYGSTSSCDACTTDSTTGRPAYTDAAGGASSCSVCPAVTGTYASRALGTVGSYRYYPALHSEGINGCYADFYDDDPNATYGTICYYNDTDGDYGGQHSWCQIYEPSACGAGYGSIITSQTGWNGSYVGGYGIDFMKNKVCGACPGGTYSAEGDLSCSACSTLGGGLYTSSAGGGDASSCYVSTTAGYYLADKDNSSQTICPAVNYCPSATLYWPNANTPTACPTADSSTARTTYPDNYYNPTMTRIYNQNWSTGLPSINSCQANYNFTNNRGTFNAESVHYNSSTGKYDRAGYEYYTSINPGYYGMTRLNDDYCANGVALMYYQNAEPCPAGSYCPGLSSMPSCSSGTYNETIGINACTGATYSGNGAASCTACPTGYNYNTTNGKSSVTQCQTNCAAGQWISAPGTLLPNGYTRIEYLESTGTQYIDTGIKLTSNDVIYEWNAKDNDPASVSSSLFGAEYYTGIERNGDPRLFGGIFHGYNAGRGLWFGSTHGANIGYDSSDGAFHSWQLSINANHTASLTKDGAPTWAGTISWTDELNKANTIAIYGNHTTDYISQLSSVAYKYFKIIDNGSLVFDGIPARRNSDGVLGMYDLVSGNFFTNAGSGTFIAGPDVTSGTGQCTSVEAGYAATGGVADFGSTIARTQCTGATYSNAGAASCTACPTVTGAYASRAIGNYGYNGGYSVHTTPEQCWATFNDDDAAGTYYFACYYNDTDGRYGGPNSYCDIYSWYISACAAGAYKTIETLPEWNLGDGGHTACYGMDCIKGKVCSNVGAGYYSADGDLTRTACPTGLYTVGYGHGADEANDCGHILHVGNYELYARQNKVTTPSINIKMPDNNIYYVSLSPSNHNISPLHVSYEGSQYTAYDDSLMYGERSFN